MQGSENAILRLAREGLFPVVEDGETASTGLSVSGTLQGEGKLAGMPSLFLRLFGCNLNCHWRLPDGTISPCDTPSAIQSGMPVTKVPAEDLARRVAQNLGAISHLVITGGEPVLQADSLVVFLDYLHHYNPLVKVTMETNGTLFCEPLAQRLNLVSISPKLDSADAMGTMHRETRINTAVLQNYLDYRNSNPAMDLQLKFVIASEEDEKQVITILDTLHGYSGDDILLMPLGSDTAELAQTTTTVVGMAIRNGWRFAPRMHIALFGCGEGV